MKFKVSYSRRISGSYQSWDFANEMDIEVAPGEDLATVRANWFSWVRQMVIADIRATAAKDIELAQVLEAKEKVLGAKLWSE